MASVASGGASPHSGYDPLQSGGSQDDNESWQYLDLSSNPASIGLYSPASGSLNSFAIVGPNPHAHHTSHPSPPAVSPLALDTDPVPFPPTTTFADQPNIDAFATTSSLSSGEMPQMMGSARDIGHLLSPHELIGPQLTSAELNSFLDFTGPMPSLPLTGFDNFDMSQQQALDIGIPPSMGATTSAPPWTPMNLKVEDFPVILEDRMPPQPQPSPNISAHSASLSPPPKSPMSSSSGGSKPSSSIEKSSIRKVKSSRVEKKKQAEPANQFVIVTPNTISAHAGKPNPFECFEALRATQRGRKGPLANDTKESALQVRRLGACFCCHARKVKCDKERPCKNCKKLTVAVPQIVCWQFQDFLPVLFPEFIRGHFRKDEMARFVNENIEGFAVGGVERPCTVELFSGGHFSAILSIKAKFFTAKTPDVLQHWHLAMGQNQIELESRSSAPIGVELDGSARDDLRKRSKEYIAAIVQEPYYAEQVTDALRHTDLPRKVLKIVHTYARNSDNPIVRRALSIYAMHYVMTRHLCLTRTSILALQSTHLVPHNIPYVTPRVLNRQIKSIIDELLMREMTLLFESFSKSLKPKSRREWAPCLAAFLVLCLFMEALETAADTFVISQNEIDMRNKYKQTYKRAFALNLNREVEKLPFRQVAYQFHQIYQTHSREAGTRGFNPLMDEGVLEVAELDGPAVEMVGRLRELLVGPSWDELDFLCMDPILPNEEDHPYPRDTSFNYTGRLVAKFLLSFTDEKYILDGNI